MIELIDIINESTGVGENKEPKSGLSVSEQFLDATDELKTLKEHVFTNSVLNVILNGDYIVFDLMFPPTARAEQRVLWNYLERFGENQNKCYGKEDSPVLSFTVLPLKFSGKYFYTLINPIYWSLQPSAPGGDNDTIRLLFEDEALNIFESEGIDEKEIDFELEKEEYENQRLEEIEKRKQEEHEEYLNRLNRKFNNNEN